jgi:hypothetical protein
MRPTDDNLRGGNVTPKESREIKDLIECVRINDFNLEPMIGDQIEQATMRDVYLARIDQLLKTEEEAFHIPKTWANDLLMLVASLYLATFVLAYLTGYLK